VCALALAGLSIYAVYVLVHARFDEAHAAIGSTRLPAEAMALVFVTVLLGDMLCRVFLLSEIRAQTLRWNRDRDRLTARFTRRHGKQAKAWVWLRDAVSVKLDRYERIVGTGARLITDARATSAGPRPDPVLDEGRAAHQDAVGRLGLPDPAQLRMFGTPLALGPLRRVGDAIDTLRRWPAGDQQGFVGELDDLVNRLYQLTDPASPDPAEEQTQRLEPWQVPVQREALSPSNGARVVPAGEQ
jgi:hypothetical protein